MASETETLALHLVRALYEATGGRPQVWRELEELDAATTDAIEFRGRAGMGGRSSRPPRLSNRCRPAPTGIAPALNGVTLAPWQIYRRLASVLPGLAFTMARLNGLGV
jgi:hypothetical protein